MKNQNTNLLSSSIQVTMRLESNNQTTLAIVYTLHKEEKHCPSNSVFIIKENTHCIAMAFYESSL